jgi:adenine-specific DNA-methyltransferase
MDGSVGACRDRDSDAGPGCLREPVGGCWLTRPVVVVASSSFSWPNDGRLLVARGETDYEWVDELPGGVSARDVACLGTGDVSGTVVCGDGLDAIDALTARKTLGPGVVRLVYIDPPFGTGKRFGHYLDGLAESAWLSMLKDRLEALKPTLSDDASVWVHLDETMSHKARFVLDRVLGSDAYVATIVWQKRVTVESRTAVSVAHDPILVYAPNGPKHWKTVRNRLTGNLGTSNRDGDPRGPWRDAPFTAPGYRPGQHYVIVNPAGVELLPPRDRSWFATEPVFRRLVEEGRIWWPRDGAGRPRLKNFEIDALQVPNTIWSGKEVGTNDEAKRHLATLFPTSASLFDTPKPEQLLRRILHIATNPGDLVVDLFAGSGTTAATAHKMGRRWVVAERLVATVATVLVPRLKQVVEGADAGGITTLAGWSGGGAFEVLQASPRVGKAPRLQLLPSTPSAIAG